MEGGWVVRVRSKQCEVLVAMANPLLPSIMILQGQVTKCSVEKVDYIVRSGTVHGVDISVPYC